jgi:hypothetical protein
MLLASGIHRVVVDSSDRGWSILYHGREVRGSVRSDGRRGTLRARGVQLRAVVEGLRRFVRWAAAETLSGCPVSGLSGLEWMPPPLWNFNLFEDRGRTSPMDIESLSKMPRAKGENESGDITRMLYLTEEMADSDKERYEASGGIRDIRFRHRHLDQPRRLRSIGS